jgi:hypothetical protein
MLGLEHHGRPPGVGFVEDARSGIQIARLGTTPGGHIGDQVADHIGGSRAVLVTSDRHAARLVLQRVGEPGDSARLTSVAPLRAVACRSAGMCVPGRMRAGGLAVLVRGVWFGADRYLCGGRSL